MKEDRDRGFTAIELGIVILIIAILITIVIPTFLGARKRAQERRDPPPTGLVISKHMTSATCDEVTTQYNPALKIPVTETREVACEVDEQPDNPATYWVLLEKCSEGTGPPSQRCTRRDREMSKQEWGEMVPGRSYVE